MQVTSRLPASLGVPSWAQSRPENGSTDPLAALIYDAPAADRVRTDRAIADADADADAIAAIADLPEHAELAVVDTSGVASSPEVFQKSEDSL